MLHLKTIMACLILSIVMCLPQAIGSTPETVLVIEDVNSRTTEPGFSPNIYDNGPRKKKSKKRKGHFLDRKRKMKNGKSCPSF